MIISKSFDLRTKGIGLIRCRGNSEVKYSSSSPTYGPLVDYHSTHRSLSAPESNP